MAKDTNNINNNRMTITQVSVMIGVVPRTIMRWEDTGKVQRAKRDWRGWRVYTEEDLEELRRFHDTLY